MFGLFGRSGNLHCSVACCSISEPAQAIKKISQINMRVNNTIALLKSSEIVVSTSPDTNTEGSATSIASPTYVTQTTTA